MQTTATSSMQIRGTLESTVTPDTRSSLQIQKIAQVPLDLGLASIKKVFVFSHFLVQAYFLLILSLKEREIKKMKMMLVLYIFFFYSFKRKPITFNFT